MNLLIYCAFPFPVGLSGTNRIISYSRGLIGNDIYVKVHCIFPTEKRQSKINNIYIGSYKGIEFEYSLKNTVWPKQKLFKYFKGAFAILVFFIKLIFKYSSKKYTLVLASYDGLIINFICGLITRLKGQKFFIIVDEYPRYIRYEYKKKPILYHLFEKKSLSFCYGFISMTHTLLYYYKPKLPKNCKTLILPMTVEMDRFINSPITKNHRIITYIGELGNNKDGVEDLISSFSMVAKEYEDVTLRIIGDTKNKTDYDRIINKVTELGLKSRIQFTGRVNSDKVPELLLESSILALARPQSKRAEGGFPTKLGEYLATGIPIVVTCIGEIPLYLKHREHVFLAEPGNTADFANKLKEVLSDYDKALIIGNNGRNVAQQIFDSKIQAKKLASFLIGQLS